MASKKEKKEKKKKKDKKKDKSKSEQEEGDVSMQQSKEAPPPKEDPDAVLHAAGWDYLPVPPPEQCNYAVTGNESQVLTVKLQVGDVVLGEPGTMMYLTDGVRQSVNCNECCNRCCTGEDCCTLALTNTGSTGLDGFAALTPNFPMAKVVPVNLAAPEVGGTLIAQSGAYMAAIGQVSVQVSWDCNLGRCCCGGMGMIRQKLVGDGTVFLSSSGTMIQKVLEQGETILLDNQCLLAYADTCKLDIRRTGGIVGMFGGGEGIFNAAVTGPGLVVAQSMNEFVFLQALAAEKMYRR